ncbi:hypothetical protein HGA88_02595 [Candidatus Roizmanbacteria bacterium]|nr:hypothetical protein [Candidatus Roizmanbacteria bacterium]
MAVKSLAIQTVIKRGIDSLKKHQEQDGSYVSFSTPQSPTFQNAVSFRSAFSTYLILQCLEKNTDTHQLIEKSIQFLLHQKTSAWTFNYWGKNTPEMKKYPFPDDLDDIFCALAALKKHSPEAISPKVLAKVVQLLTEQEVKVGGPYKTWVAPHSTDKTWQDIDTAVNANIAFFLAGEGITLPRVVRFIDSFITKGVFDSPYYYGEMPVLYFISRCYNGKKMNILNTYLKNMKQEQRDPLFTALRITALLKTGEDPSQLESDIEYLLLTDKNGDWGVYPFVVEVLPGKGKLYSGSSALTTAFCIEALGNYLEATKRKIILNTDKENIHETIVRTTQELFSSLDEPLKTHALQLFNKILKEDSRHIIALLPYFVRKSLIHPKKPVHTDLVIQLGVANVLGWLAYTIYDDFLDEEGDPKTLSVANMALRTIATIASEMEKTVPGYASVFHTIMNIVDTANIWEVSNCRGREANPCWGEYEKLADRSYGHALGPLGILMAAGYDQTSDYFQQFSTFFRHYLIAKQLHDDAHDWEADLQQEHSTPVVTLLLHHPCTDTKPLSELFWTEVIDEVVLKIMHHTKQARQAITQMSQILNTDLYEALLTALEVSAQKALSERQKTIDFVQAFSK